MNSIYRPLNLGGTASAVSIDVKQRAIFSVPHTRISEIRSEDGARVGQVTSEAVICAEPSPDALSAYVLSAGAAANLPAPTVAGPSQRAQGQLAGVLSETSGSIGLRTQSIQLLRDGLFSNCLAYMNGAVDAQNFYLLQRRSQNFTLGLLAIEQLTGALKADQLALGTAGLAATGSENAEKQEDALEAAKTSMNEAQTEHAKRKLDLSNAAAKASTQLATLKAAEEAYVSLMKTSNPDDATKARIAEADQLRKKERATLEAAQNEINTKQIESDEAKRAVEQASSRVILAEENLSQARMRIRTAASANASLTRAGGVPAIITDKVAEAVANIVSTVLDESGRGEGCYALIEHWNDTSSASFKEAIGHACNKSQIINKAIDLEKKIRQTKRELY